MKRSRKMVWISVMLTIVLSLLPACAGKNQREEMPADYRSSAGAEDIGQGEEAGDTAATDSPVPEPEEGVEIPEEKEAGSETENSDELLATLLFASDYQREEGWPEPAETLSALLDVVCDEGYVLDNAILCGDYNTALSNAEPQ